MTDEDRIGFDEGRILELMREYRDASTRRERRDIETEVLEETVWKAPKLEPNELLLTRQELESLLEELIQAVEEGDRLAVERLQRYPSFRLYLDD